MKAYSIMHASPKLMKNDAIGNYIVEEVHELSTMNSTMYAFKHTKSGARHIHIHNDTNEKTFGVAFKTLPNNSSGVAHVLEHTLLCESEKYQIQNPFYLMQQRSMCSFMNALTASDWTLYTYSTHNDNDYFNLLSVYLNTIFFPRLTEINFRQEGIRLEIDSDNSKAYFSGVVYNEMTGLMTSPDQILYRQLLSELFPDTVYSNHSGGDPRYIPDLTFEDILSFYKTYYHPDNSYFYSFGNIPLETLLNTIDDMVLKSYVSRETFFIVPPLTTWSEGKAAHCLYPKNIVDGNYKGQFCFAWKTVDICNDFEVLVLSLMDQLLLGNDASPLKKALLDSGLGASLIDQSGFDSRFRSTVFTCGLKDIARDSCDQIERLIFDTLEQVIDQGFDDEEVESAIHQFEFDRKEITNTPYPYGVKILITILSNWIHGGNPANILSFESNLNKLRQCLQNKGFFEGKIKQYLIDNHHKLRLEVFPDQQMKISEATDLAAKLDSIYNEMDEAKVAKIIDVNKKFHEFDDNLHNLNCLPSLRVQDIPPNLQNLLPETHMDNRDITHYHLNKTEISYFFAAFGCGKVPECLIRLVPFFCYTYTRVGTQQTNSVQIARLIDYYTGGIEATSISRTYCHDKRTDQSNCLPFIYISAKCLIRNSDGMFMLLHQLFNQTFAYETHKVLSLLKEYQASLKESLIENGHLYSMRLSSRHLSTVCLLDEWWHGIYQLEFINKTIETLSDSKLSDLINGLHELKDCIFSKDNIKIGVGCDSSDFPFALESIEHLIDSLPGNGSNGFGAPTWLHITEMPVQEGWCTTTPVSFVAMSFKTVRMDIEEIAPLAILSKLINTVFLHHEIREKGGAYASIVLYNPENGLFSMGSYWDPNVAETIRAFHDGIQFIKSGNFDQKDVDNAIIQVCSEIDQPIAPGHAINESFKRRVIGIKDSDRQLFKYRLLNLTVDDIVSATNKYFIHAEDRHSIAVISNVEKLTIVNTGSSIKLNLRHLGT